MTLERSGYSVKKFALLPIKIDEKIYWLKTVYIWRRYSEILGCYVNEPLTSKNYGEYLLGGKNE